MPELNPKPSEARKGHTITASWLNQLRDAIPRTITGDGVEVKRIGDRYILSTNPDEPTRPESEIQMMVVVEELDDYLICRYAGEIRPPTTYDPLFPDIILTTTINTGLFPVAKPRWLQKSWYHNTENAVSLDGVDVRFKYIDIGMRIATPDITGVANKRAAPYFSSSQIEKITPGYFTGELIRVAPADTGMVLGIKGVGDVPIAWMDINDHGRNWQRADYAQRIRLISRSGGEYWEASLLVRDNKNHAYVSQDTMPIWALVPSSTHPTTAQETTAFFIGVETGGVYYLSIQEESIGHDLTDGEWWLPLNIDYDPDVGVEEWEAGDYLAGDITSHDSKVWAALVDTDAEPGVDQDWLEVEINNRDGDYSPTEIFFVGDIVREQRCLYQVSGLDRKSYNLGVTLEEIRGAISGTPGAGLAMYVKYADDGTGVMVHTLTDETTTVRNDCTTPIASGRLVDILREPFSGLENARDRCAFVSPVESDCPLETPPDDLCVDFGASFTNRYMLLSPVVSEITPCGWSATGPLGGDCFGAESPWTVYFAWDTATSGWTLLADTGFPSEVNHLVYRAASWDGIAALTLTLDEDASSGPCVSEAPATITVNVGACSGDPYGSGCADAATIKTNGAVNSIETTGAGEVWVKFAAPYATATTNYKVDIVQTTGTDVGVEGWLGVCPDGLNDLQLGGSGTFCQVVSQDGGVVTDWFYIRFTVYDASTFSVAVTTGGTC